MKLKDFALLMFLQFLALFAVAIFQHSPGYMDADYYTIMGQQVAHGTTAEPFIWNYLDDPQGVPHPGFAYWQPLAAFLAAWGIRLMPSAAPFSAARIPFILLALLIPALTAWLAYTLTRRRDLALFSGGLAIASGFYFPYLAVPDTFTPLMVLGALFFIIAGWPEAWHLDDIVRPWRWARKLLSRSLAKHAPFFLGVLAGLMHFARAEGFLWLLAAWGVLVLRRRKVLRSYVWVLIGYGVVMFPWMLRNLSVFGTPLSPGGLRTLWLTDYNELYTYPASQLTFAHWWASGLKAILTARLKAAGTNLLTAWTVQGQILWLPFVLLGAWHTRSDRRVKIGLGMWLVLWVLMSAVFPFAGARGGFFHAGAALQPLFWALAPIGFAIALRPLARWRGWHLPQAQQVLGWGLVAATVLLTVLVVQRRVIGDFPTHPVWDKPARAYAELGTGLHNLGIPNDALILVNNPPGFTLITGYPSLAVPNGDADVVAEVARRYGARYWALESNHPKQQNHYYCHPTTVPEPWKVLGKVGYTPVFVLEH
ncbi:MAG: hypothetical protein GXO56_00430 [Chloroflexi bacterium]|nr:hypothetical protein [Chloroflexota bacterium]